MLQAPPMLLGAALLFWGWHTNLFMFAVLMALALEVSRLVRWRLDFVIADYNRLFDFCTVLFGAVAMYCVSTRNSTNEILLFFDAANLIVRDEDLSPVAAGFLFFQWWPLLLFPIAMVQAYGPLPVIPYSSVSLFLRRALRRAGKPQLPTPGCNAAYPFFAVCLLSSSLAKVPGPGFYLGFCGLAGVALWWLRPRRFRALAWLVAFAVLMKAGYWSQRKLHQMQDLAETKIAQLVNLWLGSGSRREIRTEIGQLGELKLSGAIVMRAWSEVRPPDLLRDAAYDIYESGEWYSSNQSFKRLAPSAGGESWVLQTGSGRRQRVEIAVSLPGGRGQLAIPRGAVELGNLPVEELATNVFGSVRVVGAPGLLMYEVSHGTRDPFNAPPVADEDGHLPALEIPENLDPVLGRISGELRLAELAAEARVRAVADYFAADFRYQLYAPAAAGSAERRESPVLFFLSRSRAGHCELFASAAALLLRKAGIPSRYVVGWAVQEQARDGRTYLIRDRHAHAWAEYWRNGAWHTLDVTPGDWFEQESQSGSFLEPLRDWWSNAWYEFSWWRYYGANEGLRRVLIGVLLVLLAALAWRLVFRRSRSVPQPAPVTDGSDPAANWPGRDSEFYALERHLATQGFARQPGETITGWLLRLREVPAVPAEMMERIRRLHYRYRFDPLGIDAEDRRTLRESVGKVLGTTAKPADA